jgi:hypothetical protein
MSYLKEHDDHVAKNGGASLAAVSLISYLGEITLLICNDCPYEKFYCEHVFNDWVGEEPTAVLICRLCGTDGT